jgi:hypothetical protein
MLNVVRFLIVGNKVCAFVALWLVVKFHQMDLGEAAACMVAAMVCNVMFVLKLQEIEREMR